MNWPRSQNWSLIVSSSVVNSFITGFKYGSHSSYSATHVNPSSVPYVCVNCPLAVDLIAPSDVLYKLLPDFVINMIDKLL